MDASPMGAMRSDQGATPPALDASLGEHRTTQTPAPNRRTLPRALQWQERIQRYQASGLTMRQFAAQEGISANSLSWWKWRLSQTGQDSRRRPLLASLTIALQAPHERVGTDSPIEVRAGDRSVFVRRGFDPETLVRVVQALEVGAQFCSHIEPPSAEGLTTDAASE